MTNRQGKNNAQGNKTSPGQNRSNPKQGKGHEKGKKTPAHKKGLTRFSDNQFSDRKKSK